MSKRRIHTELELSWAQVALAAAFVTSLITAQIIAVKILSIPAPDVIPVVGGEILVPAGVLAYALTFASSDCYAELYGHKSATKLVNAGFLMNFFMLGLVWLAILLPGSPAGVDPATFESVLQFSTNIVAASLVAYVVSQNWDVFTFGWLRNQTNGEHLWLRNIGSTTTSQLIDTIIFVIVGFFAVPKLLGFGMVLPTEVLIQLIVGQYLIKLGIAIAETPVVYAIVGAIESTAEPEPTATQADPS